MPSAEELRAGQRAAALEVERLAFLDPVVAGVDAQRRRLGLLPVDHDGRQDIDDAIAAGVTYDPRRERVLDALEAQHVGAGLTTYGAELHRQAIATAILEALDA